MQRFKVYQHVLRYTSLAFSLLGLLQANPAYGCGGGGITSEAGIVVDSQYVLMSLREGGTTDVVVQINVPRANTSFGLLIPVPSEPTLDQEPAPSSEMEELDRATAPEIVFNESSSDGPLIGCGSAKSGSDSVTPRVTAGEFVEIGPVVAVTLKGDSVDAVTDWLSDNGFVLPTTNTEVLERYVSAGSYFIAVKRNRNTSTTSSIGLHYSLEGDHRMLSLAFAKIGADEELGFTLFLAAKDTIGPSSPFTALTLADLDAGLLRDNYKDALKEAVADHESKAFVIESTTSASELRPLLPQLAKLLDDDATVTRATTVVAREQLTTDVVFATPFTDDVPRTRTLSVLDVNRGSMRGAWLGGVMMGAAAGFSFRRRKA